MAIRDFIPFLQKEQKPTDFSMTGVSDLIGEDFKGKEPRKLVKFPADLGEEHPFDFALTEGVYVRFGRATAAIDMIVDRVFGFGYWPTSDDARAQKLIEDWLEDVDSDSTFRSWLKEALIKGTGFMELGIGKNGSVDGCKILDAKWMYILRDDKGKNTEYRQYVGKFPKNFNTTQAIRDEQVIKFSEDEVAVLPVNEVGNSPYGYGLIWPAMKSIEKYLAADDDMHTIISRKANSQIDVTLGFPPSAEMPHGSIPNQSDIDAFGAKLLWMNNKREWVHGPNVKMGVLDFGNVGDKFSFVLEHDDRDVMDSLRVPAVLMGRGNIPEGLANVQMENWISYIRGLQAMVEKVIEKQIFDKVVAANGLKGVHVEMNWGTPSFSEMQRELDNLKNLLQVATLDPVLRREIELKVANTLDIDEEKMTGPEAERYREENQPQPVVPGQNRTESFSADYSLAEWLGFNYAEYLRKIKAFILGDKFELLAASNSEEILAGKLSKGQISALKSVLISGFSNGRSIRQISDSVDKSVRPKDLYAVQDGKVVMDAAGEPVLKLSADVRPEMIARTETTRAAAQGALDTYRENHVDMVKWVASTGERTCDECAALDQQVFKMGEQPEIPRHSNCRCTWLPVVA